MEKLCAIVLAAGLSSRMGENKLLLEYRGRPMAESIFQNIKQNAAWFGGLVAVGREQGIAKLAEKYGFTYVHNPEPERGMGHSLALGVAAVGECGGFLLALADMPDLKPGTIHTLCEGFAKAPERIAVPVCGGRRGNPTVFPARLREELAALDGDRGGRDLLRREQNGLARVQVYDPGILRDIDTRDDWKRIQGN